MPTSEKKFSISKSVAVGRKIGIYGTGGIGKTDLALLLRNMGMRVVAADIERSTPAGTECIDGLGPDCSWNDLRAALQTESLWQGVNVVLLESATKAEELCMTDVFETIPKNDKGDYTDTLEGYGYGKGYGHLYNRFIPLLGDLERHSLAGRHVIVVCHEVLTEAKNPDGENWDRIEPRLMHSKNASIRHRFREWLDDLFCIRYDVVVGDDGKGKGGGSRSIYTTEKPSHWAKSRKLSKVYPYGRGDTSIWTDLFAKGQ